MKTYIISKDYSPFTGLRYCCKSDHSGEDFYHKKLNGWMKEAVENNEEMTIILDGGEDGYGPSFLDESFGNLVYDFTLEVVNRLVHIDPVGDSEWGESIQEDIFPVWEENRVNHVEPEKTEEHEPWYKLIDGQLQQKAWIKKTEKNDE